MTAVPPPPFTARIERHRPDLPVYLIVPSEAVLALGTVATVVVEAAVDGRPLGRRSIKPWGDGRWFMELTQRQCAALGVGAGDTVSVALTPAPEAPPALLTAVRDAGLEAQWQALTAAQRRSIAEDVFAARTTATATARIRRAVAGLADRGASGSG